MKQKRHNVGDVYLENDHGMAWLMQANTIGCDKIFCNREVLSRATVSPNSFIYYNNQQIGKISYHKYNAADEFLVVCFTLSIGRNHLPDADCLYAVPKYNNDGIQCIQCQRMFKIGAIACDCIETAPAVQIPKIELVGVSIHNGLNDNVNMLDSRQHILNQYFGGIAASIRVDNEEF